MHQISDESRLIVSDELNDRISHLISEEKAEVQETSAIVISAKRFPCHLESISSTRRTVTVEFTLPIKMPHEMSLCIIKGGSFDSIEVLGVVVPGKRIKKVSMRDIDAVEYTNISISFAKE